MGKSKELAELGDVVTQSGGNVGINASNPAWSLHIANATAPVIQLEETSVGNTFIGQDYDTFFIRRGTIGSNSALAVDASGRVTMPYQPAFYAGFASGSANSYVTTYQTPKVNVGNHFNSTTGIFTAPVGGRYLFTAAVMTSAVDNSYHYFYFYRNSSAYSSLHHTHSDSTEGYRHSSGSVIMDMSANDTCRLYVAASRPYQSNNNPWSSFGGHLIG